MNLFPDKINGFDNRSTSQQNQPSPPPRPQEDDRHWMVSSSAAFAISEGLDHMRLPFAYKLHILLCDMETKGWDHVISWVKDGKAFKIHDRKKFETLIQPQYFKQSKIASFIRQCYMYGFSKIERGPNQGSYVHPEFCKDDQDKSLAIQRHCSTRADHKRKNTPSTPFPRRNATHTPSSASNTSRMVTVTTISEQRQGQHDADVVFSSPATSSCQTIRTWQHPAPTGYLTDSTDPQWPVRVGRDLTVSVLQPNGEVGLGCPRTHHTQGQPLDWSFIHSRNVPRQTP